MSTDRQKLEQIFSAALETSNPAERQAYVARVCGEDEALRQEVQSLLSAHDEAE